MKSVNSAEAMHGMHDQGRNRNWSIKENDKKRKKTKISAFVRTRTIITKDEFRFSQQGLIEEEKEKW